MTKKLKTKEDVILALVIAAKSAMKELDFAMPCTPTADVWVALSHAVKDAEKLGIK